MTKCAASKRYTGKRSPKCNHGNGCDACWMIRIAYLAAELRMAKSRANGNTASTVSADRDDIHDIHDIHDIGCRCRSCE